MNGEEIKQGDLGGCSALVEMEPRREGGYGFALYLSVIIAPKAMIYNSSLFTPLPRFLRRYFRSAPDSYLGYARPFFFIQENQYGSGPERQVSEIEMISQYLGVQSKH